MTSTEGLVERLERAKEGSRELDLAIARATRDDVPEIGDGVFDWHEGKYASSDPGSLYQDQFNQPAPPNVWKSPHYTTSIDVALTLVPEGFWWEIRQMYAPNSPMRHFGNRGLFHARVGKSYGSNGALGENDNPALALCIAALKAREMMEAENAAVE